MRSVGRRALSSSSIGRRDPVLSRRNGVLVRYLASRPCITTSPPPRSEIISRAPADGISLGVVVRADPATIGFLHVSAATRAGRDVTIAVLGHRVFSSMCAESVFDTPDRHSQRIKRLVGTRGL